MKLIKPSYKILTDISEGGIKELKYIEQIGRVCYKSEDKISDTSYLDLISKFMKMGHLAVIEHSILSVKFIVDRGVSHELVRHRIMSYAQESTRYCNYSKDKFGNELTFIVPSYLKENNYSLISAADGKEHTAFEYWKSAMSYSEYVYFNMLSSGVTPQEARAVLPNSLKTEIVATGNYREWLNILELRTSSAAHPQIREIMLPLLSELHDRIPVIFDKLYDERL